MPDAPPANCQGVLELHPKGFGFLRDPARHLVERPGDPYVPQPLIQKFRLAQGLMVAGPVEPPRKGSTGPRLAAIDQRLAEPGRTDQDRVEYGERRERLLDLRRDPPGALGLSAS